jgi:hypothetical protein
VTTKTLNIKSGGRVSARANAGSTGDAGTIGVVADNIDLNAGSIVSTSLPGASGRSGDIIVTAKLIAISNQGSIESSSSNANTAGFVGIETESLLIDGIGSSVSSENLFAPAGQSPRAIGAGTANAAAGDISITASEITLNQGGAITTNSLNGPAGGIFLTLPTGSFLRLESTGSPSLITTSSGPGTGGVINIASPFAIISNGGSILAKGQQGGADVVIQSNNFIRSADRANLVSVDGSFLIDSNLTDVSSGTTTPATNFLDASKVLSGQCAATRASGETSVLSARKTGPYAVAPPTQPTSMRSSGSTPLGACL